MSEQSISDKSAAIRNETAKYGNTRGRVAAVIDDINATKANKIDLEKKIDKSSVGVKGGVAPLGSDGKVPASYLPDIPSDADVLTVNNKIGHVKIDKADVGLGNADNTSDSNKPISNAQKLVNSSLSAKDLALQNQINAEVSNRQRGDEALNMAVTQANLSITSEAAARASADSALSQGVQNVSNSLAAESNARKKADDALNSSLANKVDKTKVSVLEPDEKWKYVYLLDEENTPRRMLAEVFRNNAVKFLGTIKPDTVIPAGQVWGYAGPGTYPNAGNITVGEGKVAIMSNTGNGWEAVQMDIGASGIANKANTTGDNLENVLQWQNALDVYNKGQVHELLQKKNETLTTLGDATLSGNVLSIRYTGENGIEQVKTVDLSGLITKDVKVENATYEAATNTITITDTDGQQFPINLGEFSLITEVDEDGNITLTQEGIEKLKLARVSQTGSYNDLKDKPELDKKADLGEDGKVLPSQLPKMEYMASDVQNDSSVEGINVKEALDNLSVRPEINIDGGHASTTYINNQLINAAGA